MTKLYPVNLVGESKYQREIARCAAGDRVFICHELGNPYDDLALRVETHDGDIIGYIAKSNWLRDAIHEQGRGATATVLSIMGEVGQPAGVVLNVQLTDDDIPARNYGEIHRRAIATAPAAEPVKREGLFQRLFR